MDINTHENKIFLGLKKGHIDACIKEATKNTEYEFKLGSIIFKGKKIYSRGRNYYHRNTKNIKLHDRFLKWEKSVHSEHASIINANQSLKGHSILTVRLLSNKQFGLAKPCIHCLKYMNYVGIKNIYYSIPCYPFVEKLK